MTPLRRDRNLLRVRRATGVIAGASLAATGVFAGLAASKPKATKSSSASAVRVRPATTTTAPATVQSQEEETQSQAPAPAIVVTPTQQAPVASSGGS
ncbi:MAG: hypothetical protein KGL94_11750 [Acidobacteriota bacterium]|nr:hypothetical protein [Acidobacteriota bacterium]